MKEYICQLKNGMMLAQDGNTLLTEETGYPYPDMPKSNIETLRDLVFKNTGIYKPDSFYYNYCNIINNYFDFIGASGMQPTVISLVNYFISGSLNNLKVIDLGTRELLKLGDYSLLYDNYHGNIILARNDDLVMYNVRIVSVSGAWEEVFNRLETHLYTLINTHVDKAQFIELLKLAILYGDPNRIVNIEYSIKEFVDYLFFDKALFQGYIVTYIRDNIVAYFDKEYSIELDKSVFNMLQHDLTWYFNVEQRGAFLIAIADRNLCKTHNVDFTASLGNGFVSFFMDEVSTYYKNNLVLNYFDNMYIGHLSENSLSDKCLFGLYNTFIDFKQSINKNVYVVTASKVYYTPTSFEDGEIIWDLHNQFDLDLIQLAPMFFSVGGLDLGVKEKGLETLCDTNMSEILSGMYRVIDDRTLLFYNGKTYDDLVKEFNDCFTIYNKERYTVHLGDPYGYTISDTMNHYISDIPKIVLEVLGEFSLFARVFLKAPRLFQQQEDIKVESDKITMKYKLGYHLLVMDGDLIDMSNKMFNEGFKGACIVNFIQVILCSLDAKTMFPLSLSKINVSFNQDTQEVTLTYNCN